MAPTRLDPAHSEALRAHARLAQDGARFDEAEHLYRAAVEADPGSARVHHDLGGFYKLLGRLDEAEASLQAAHRLAPGDAVTRHALGIVLLSQGRYAEGWPHYDARHEIPELGLVKPRLPFPEWRGEDPAGRRLLIFPEQGLGDQIQFARFAPWLAGHGADVTLMCHPALARLFGQSFDVRVIAASGAVDFPDPDYWVMSGSVAGRSGLRPDELPNAPYLRTDPPAGGGAGGIGLATHGNPAHANDANRSLAPALAERLFALPGAISLHPEDTGATDFAQTAAIVDGLDLVISVDTSVAHLAAAMGKPTWVLLPKLMTDWRWMEGREDSPWYPTAKLFRQANPGDWGPAIDAICAQAPKAAHASGTARRSERKAAPRAGGSLAEVGRREALVAAGKTDRARWADPENLQPAWDGRAQLAARMIRSGARVLDLGCGAMALERFLPPGCAYIPCDLVARDSRTLVCDFNAGEFPVGLDCDEAVALGVLEYLFDAPAFLAELRRLERPVVMSYCVAGGRSVEARRALGWVNDFTAEAFEALLEAAGFSVVAREMVDPQQILVRLSPATPVQAAERSVWVLSFNNVENFGDRLGVHLLSQVLPPHARLRFIHHTPWDAPPEEDVDLVVLGIGNSLFGSLVTDQLIALLGRAKASIGLFGTQYRSTLPPQRLGPVLDRLDHWFARSQEDLLLYGQGRANASHLGDWLAQAFPLARPSIDDTLTVGPELSDDGAIDRTIALIQSYRRVFSPRLHPLLCALCSAELVAYQEQRPDGREASGKFRSLFLDIFGADRPEGQFWPVDREAVVRYKLLVDRNIAQARGLIAGLL